MAISPKNEDGLLAHLVYRLLNQTSTAVQVENTPGEPEDWRSSHPQRRSYQLQSVVSVREHYPRTTDFGKTPKFLKILRQTRGQANWSDHDGRKFAEATSRNKVARNTPPSHCATTVTIVVVLVILFGFGRLIMQHHRKQQSQAQNNPPAEMIEFEPLN